MEQEDLKKVLVRVEEYVDWTSTRLARAYCERVAPGAEPASVRMLPKGYLVVELLRQEFGAQGREPADDE